MRYCARIRRRCNNKRLALSNIRPGLLAFLRLAIREKVLLPNSNREPDLLISGNVLLLGKSENKSCRDKARGTE